MARRFVCADSADSMTSCFCCSSVGFETMCGSQSLQWGEVSQQVGWGCGRLRQPLACGTPRPSIKSVNRQTPVLEHYGQKAAQAHGLHDKPSFWRSQKLDQPTVVTANQMILVASHQNGRQDSYTGANEGQSVGPKLRAIVSAHGMSSETLLQHMQSSNLHSGEAHTGPEAKIKHADGGSVHISMQQASGIQSFFTQKNLLDGCKNDAHCA